MDVGRLVARAAARHGERVALEEPGAQRTFAEVGERVARLARGLLGLGLEPGDRVLDLQPNGITYVETDFGISTAGLCRVPLNARLSTADWCRIAADSGARALVVHASYADRLGGLPDLVEQVVVIGDGPGTPYERMLAEQSAEPLLLDLAPETLVSLNYSSGTTGNPKGARRTHRNRMASLQHIVVDILGGTPATDDAWCHAGPLTHATGLFSLPHFVLGARQVILRGWDPEALLVAIEERGATGTVLVPTMIARLLGHAGLSAQRTAGLRRLVYAGSPMPPEQIRQAAARITPHLVQMYGLVEAIPPVTVLSAADHAAALRGDAGLLASAGQPCLGVTLRIVDGDGRDVPEGEVGEVVTAGDHVMGGYWGAVDETAAKTVVDGWLHTGDLGRLNAAERLYLVDRKGDMIISGGFNIYPREVEDVIAELPGVVEVAVVGVDDPEWGQRVAAVYRGDVAESAVLAHCRDRLVSYKKPRQVHRVEAFPLSSTGKIAKKVLRADLAALPEGGP